MNGDKEVPGPGDSDGVGVAVVLLKPVQKEICFGIVVKNIMLPATGAHIHEGGAGVAGPIEVTLTAPDADGTSMGCVEVDREEIREIMNEPEEYYVNVHTTDYPSGAVRGQLVQ